LVVMTVGHQEVVSSVEAYAELMEKHGGDDQELLSATIAWIFVCSWRRRVRLALSLLLGKDILK
jgi:hypothetical protein